LHFTPTSESWLSLVEVFGVITWQAIRRGSFDSGKQLTAAIRTFIAGWNNRCPPFVCTRTPEQILPHTKRKLTSDAQHRPGGTRRRAAPRPPSSNSHELRCTGT